VDAIFHVRVQVPLPYSITGLTTVLYCGQAAASAPIDWLESGVFCEVHADSGHATMDTIIGTVFSVRSVPRCYKHDSLSESSSI
jgi:hypothetical protein